MNDSTERTRNLARNDRPIEAPSDDRYGVDPFAAAIARSLAGMKAPAGSVVAINGVWGSGKSSAVNLIIHHLREDHGDAGLTIIPFAGWYRGADALALAFFETLNGGIKPSLGRKSRRALPKIAKKLLKGGKAAGAAVDLAGGTGLGTLVGEGIEWFSREPLHNPSWMSAPAFGAGCKAQSAAIRRRIASICNAADRSKGRMRSPRGVMQRFPSLFSQDESIEKVHIQLAATLAGIDRRFLVATSTASSPKRH